ncbi:unnamed protein product [Withania somnifera]
MWFNKVTVPTVVWVGNRESPLNDTSGVLNFTRQGILTLLNGSGRIIWSFNATRHVQNPVAQLLDSGNLVVRDSAEDKPENYLWQSFDNPSTNDPSRGEFTWTFNPRELLQTFIMNGSIKLYRAGPWNGQVFSNAPSRDTLWNGYNYTYLSDPEEISCIYEFTDSSIIAKVLMQLNGVLQLSEWNNQTQNWDDVVAAPADNCDIYGQCHSYGLCKSGNSPICKCLDKFEPKDPTEWARGNWSKGCVRKTSLNCKKEVKFLRYTGIKLPDTNFSWYSQGVILKACVELCLTNCSCTAYANPDITGTNEGCLIWFSELMDIREFGASGKDYLYKVGLFRVGSYLFLHYSYNSSIGKVKKLRISLPLAALGLLLALCLILYIRKKKKDQNQQHFNKVLRITSSDMFCTNKNKYEELDLPLFDFENISHATNNFSLSNKLGEGGFGPVYKVMMLITALFWYAERWTGNCSKELSRYSAQGTDKFKNEVIFIAKLQHRNLVKLLGCCIQAEEKMLVYEYMPNNSLDWFLFEYAAEGKFSVKSNVFSFGVVVLEILSRKRNRGFLHPDHHHNILGHILFKEDMVMEVIDTHLRQSCNRSEVQRPCPEDRPCMESIVVVLGNNVEIPSPKGPGFFNGIGLFTEAYRFI